MITMASIGEQVRTQNNRADQNPIFAVQEKRRIRGMDSGFTDDYYWQRTSGSVSQEEVERLEALDVEADGDFYKVYYIEQWVFVMPFFTEKAAQLYIDENAHNLGETRIWAYSAYRNKEWIAIRKMLMGAK